MQPVQGRLISRRRNRRRPISPNRMDNHPSGIILCFYERLQVGEPLRGLWHEMTKRVQSSFRPCSAEDHPATTEDEDVMHRRAKSRSAEQGINRTELKRVLEHIVSSTPPSDLFELYYWVQEPSLLKIIRQLAAMPDEDREAIESFFALAQDLAVVARWDRGDRLV